MKFRQIAVAAALIALGVAAGMAAPQSSQAQSGGGQWQAAGSYATTEGGEVWMVNSATGQGRNCWWTADNNYTARYITCATSRN
jgi:hypothetical protein